MKNKSGLDKQIEEITELLVADVRLYKSPEELTAIEERDFRNDLRIFRNTIQAQAVQEAYQQGVSDTLGKVRELLKHVGGNAYVLEEYKRGWDDHKNMSLSALDHLERRYR